MHHSIHLLDIAPFGLFFALTLATVLFRRFHQLSSAPAFKNSDDVSKISWGEYPHK